jgi:uncharacterized membrane protein (DUF485 family)
MSSTNSIPGAALFIAIMNLVLFLPCACCSGIGLVAGQTFNDPTLFGSDPQQKQLFEKLQQRTKEKLPNQQTIQLATNGIYLAFSLVIVIGSIGLLSRGNWGRWACLVGFAAIIVTTIISTVYQVAFSIPATIEMQKELLADQGQAPPGIGEFIGVAMYGTVAVIAFIEIGYAFLGIILLLTPSVANFYGSGGIAQQSENWGDVR